jgi:hypothetical protein
MCIRYNGAGRLIANFGVSAAWCFLAKYSVSFLATAAVAAVVRVRHMGRPNAARIWLPPQGKRLIDSGGGRGEPAVVYPASEVGS